MEAKLNSKGLYPQTDEQIREWYDKYFPKGYEHLIDLFTPESNIASQLSSNAITSTRSTENGNRTGAKTSRKKTKSQKVDYCVYCRRNDEMPMVYNSHRLHDKNGNVVCPVLCEAVCEFCGATGDAAHTPKYCPKRPKPIWEILYK